MGLNTENASEIKSEKATRKIMLDIIIALSPVCLFGVAIFGLRALLVIVVSVASAVLSEALACYLIKKPITVGDLSAVVTGLILSLSLPPRIPLYMAAIGSAFAVIVVKMMFGGRGKNLLNPAAAARVFMMISFAGAMSTYYLPFSDLVTSATPLSGDGHILKELFFGVSSGAIGETSVVMLLFGGVYLLLRRVITLYIPLSFILTANIVLLIAGTDPLTELCSGGIVFGALFMATDYATGPEKPLGKIVFGMGCGALTVFFRLFADMPGGVAYSIVIMNLFVPLIDRLITKIPFADRLIFGKGDINA